MTLMGWVGSLEGGGAAVEPQGCLSLWVGVHPGHPLEGLPKTHLEPAEPDHAVHHLGHAEAVAEVVERVVPVVVVHAELRETRV